MIPAERRSKGHKISEIVLGRDKFIWQERSQSSIRPGH